MYCLPLQTSFKYNLKRHMERHHDGNDQAEEDVVIERTEPTEPIESVRRDATKDSMTLQTVLDEAVCFSNLAVKE